MWGFTEMNHAIWLHNLDPFLIQFTPQWGIRWYGLAYVAGFIVGLLFAQKLATKKLTPLSWEQVSEFLTYPVFGVLLGGRLGYALFYSPGLFFDFQLSFPFWGLLAVWQGGMSSHGGFIGVFLACFYFSWKNKISFFHICDLTIVGGMIGIFLGRIANFINGELMGRVCSHSLPWAVKFPQDIHRWVDYSPHKLFSLKSSAQILGISPQDWDLWMENIPYYRPQLRQLASQIVQGIQEGNQKLIEVIYPILEPRHPSQIYAALSEGLLPLIFTLWVWRKPQKPGLIGSLFLIFYSLGRIWNENFRLPDAHLSPLSSQPLGLTRGQFISIWILLLGVFCFVLCLRSKEKPLGGWDFKS